MKLIKQYLYRLTVLALGGLALCFVAVIAAALAIILMACAPVMAFFYTKIQLPESFGGLLHEFD